MRTLPSCEQLASSAEGGTRVTNERGQDMSGLLRESTKRREGYFIDFAVAVQKSLRAMPLRTGDLTVVCISFMSHKHFYRLMMMMKHH